MDLNSRMSRRVACTLAGVGIASTIAVGGVATAAPAPTSHPQVTGTNCSVAQVERALAKEDPALWKRIEANPMMKKHFESALTMTKDQRKAKRAEFRKNHPAESAIGKFIREHHLTRPEMKKTRDAVKRAKETCSRF